MSNLNILHVCLNGPYTDNWGYQDNLLPKQHRKLNHNVTVITQNRKHDQNGNIVYTDCGSYYLEDGVRVIRVAPVKTPCNKFNIIFSPYNILGILYEIKPDLIMVHGLIGSISALQVRKYMKNNNCKAVADIHEDFYNSPENNSVKYKVFRFIIRYLNKKMFPYYEKIFYLAPSSMEYAIKHYKVPIKKLELLPLGCDMDLVDVQNKEIIREKIRHDYNINENDIILCHGGKININKRTLELIKAFILLSKENKKIKLLIFGSLSDDCKELIECKISEHSDIIKYAGMLTMKQYCDIFLASDIAVFPGGQSVLWQQAIACGLAMIVRRHTGIEYLDLGGNIDYFENESVDEIQSKLKDVLNNNRYMKMKEVSEMHGAEFFSYYNIAKRVLDVLGE